MVDTKTSQNNAKSSRWWEIGALILLLGVALFLRLWQLELVPPGLHYDEAIDLKIGLDVVGGARPIYVAEGWGREGLYYYLVAAVLRFVPFNPLALRVSAVLCGMGLLLVTYGLIRRWHGRIAAWLTVAWLSLAYWPLSASRFGVRHISLPLVWGTAVLAFWWAWRQKEGERPLRRTGRFALAGFLFGLTLYTYQPARFVPFIFAAFLAYLWLFHRPQLKSRIRELAVFLIIAFLVVLPLIVILSSGLAEETDQRAFTIEPLTRLLAGDPQPVLANLVATAKVFTISGDPLESYNVPDRPIFAPAWTGILFYVGLGLALWRWRRPIYAFVLLWLLFTLLPTVLTLSAPNFNRMVAAQVPIMFLAALPMAEAAQWLARRWRRVGIGLSLAAGLVVLGWTAVSTYHDYFFTWPAHPGTRAPLNRSITAVARYLYANPDDSPVVISSPHIEDSDPYILTVSLDDADRVVRWVDSGQALAVPTGAAFAHLIVTTERWIDGDLSKLLPGLSQPIYADDDFAEYAFTFPDILPVDQPLYFLPFGVNSPAEQEPVVLTPPYPARFCFCQPETVGQVNLDSLVVTGLKPGGSLTVITSWTVQQDGRPSSLAIFTHLLDETGEIVGQQDGLGYPPHTWRTGDRFIQVHHISMTDLVGNGRYWLQMGLYQRETGQRWQLVDEQANPLSDRLLTPLIIE
ncbi:MAG: glycosyltransferase family 39 protein [Ardenticatenaceae bacterium]|nr:glycosyltransferase family 39 protein [Ardenticatenaceae bacterium]